MRKTAFRIVALAIVLTALNSPCDARADSGARAYLSWRAPHGYPRATDTVTCACRDTARTDTLYLSFEFDRPRPVLTAAEARLSFSTQGGDTLGDFWSFKRGTANGGNMWIEFAPFRDVPTVPPWTPLDEQNTEVSYDRLGRRGFLRLKYNVPEAGQQWLSPGVRYTLARVIIFNRRADLAGCRQPLCIEWAPATLKFATGRWMDLAGGERLLGWNLAKGAKCAVSPAGPAIPPWHPKSTSSSSSESR